MLRHIINNLSTYSNEDEYSFWEQVSEDNIEDFLLDYTLPEPLLNINSKNFSLIKSLLEADIIEKDDIAGSLLGSVEVDIVSSILMFTIMYGSSAECKCSPKEKWVGYTSEDIESMEVQSTVENNLQTNT